TRFSRDWSSDVCSSDLFQHFSKVFYSGCVFYRGSTEFKNFHSEFIFKNLYNFSNFFRPYAPHANPSLCLLRCARKNGLRLCSNRSEERRVGQECRSRCT